MSQKWTESNIPDQSGRTAIVTGANTGLGYETARALANRGAHVILAVRDTAKGDAAAEAIRGVSPRASVEVVALDLGSLESVRTAARELAAAHPSIDLLINNAGVMYPPKQTTEDGFELQFGTNHLGHFAFTGLLLDNVLAAKGSRVVTVASIAHRSLAKIHFDDLQWEKGYQRVPAYGQSKLANLMFSYALDRRLSGTDTIAVAAHPGVSHTELMRYSPSTRIPGVPTLLNLTLNKPLVGALATLRAATDPAVSGGQYYGPAFPLRSHGVVGHPELVTSSSQSRDEDTQRRLWAVSEELTRVTFPL